MILSWMKILTIVGTLNYEVPIEFDKVHCTCKATKPQVACFIFKAAGNDKTIIPCAYQDVPEMYRIDEAIIRASCDKGRAHELLVTCHGKRVMGKKY